MRAPIVRILLVDQRVKRAPDHKKFICLGSPELWYELLTARSLRFDQEVNLLWWELLTRRSLLVNWWIRESKELLITRSLFVWGVLSSDKSSWLQEVCGLLRESISSDESSWPQGVCWSIGELINSNKGSWLQQVCSLIRESICSDNSFWSHKVCRLVKSFRLQGVC